MGSVMHQALTRREEDIIVPGRPQIEGNNMRALPAPSYNVGVPSPRPAITPIMHNKENVSDVVVPFQPQFDDQGVPDFDLIEIMNNLESPEKATTTACMTVTTTSSAMTANNVLNNIPKSLFHNCTIQNITFNMPK